MHFYLDRAFGDHMIQVLKLPNYQEGPLELQKQARLRLLGYYNMAKDRFRGIKHLYSKKVVKDRTRTEDLFLQLLFPGYTRDELTSLSYPGVVYFWLGKELERLANTPLDAW